jgi:hypothetical protein
MVLDLDKIARREIVEERDGNRCQRCMGYSSSIMLPIQWAHVQTREYYITRWEPDNSLALCSACHVWFDNHKVLSLDWFAKKFPERWERLKRILQGNCKTTDADIREMWRSRRPAENGETKCSACGVETGKLYRCACGKSTCTDCECRCGGEV